jgi:hypothetical protein
MGAQSRLCGSNDKEWQFCNEAIMVVLFTSQLVPIPGNLLESVEKRLSIFYKQLIVVYFFVIHF